MTAGIATRSENSIATLGAGHSVLGESQAKIPVGGKIRPGIKVLTAATAKNANAKAIYDAGIKARKTFGQIEREIKEQCGIEYPLTPRNVPYFTVHPQDFIAPDAADQIMRLYGADGPSGFQLYRFPVIFPVDAWLAVMPHALKVYTRSELVYWSQYTPDGRRLCMTHAPVAVDSKAKRAQRQYGGRPVVPRAENEGICDPSKCREYQNNACNLTGDIIFFVPGISGTSAIALPTRSFYSLQQAKQKLEMVQFITGGRISGTFNGKPLFYITKKQEEVSMIDPKDGKAKRVKQWLIVLDADIDMMSVFQRGEQRALAAGSQAAAMLEGPRATEITDPDETGEDEPPPEATPAQKPAQPTEPPALTEQEVAAMKAARKTVFDGLEALGIDVEVFSRYGTRTWGEGWSRNIQSLQKAQDLLHGIADNNDVEAVKEINEIGGPL